MSVRKTVLIIVAALAVAGALMYFGKKLLFEDGPPARPVADQMPSDSMPGSGAPLPPPVGLRPLEPEMRLRVQPVPIELVPADDPSAFAPPEPALPPFGKGDVVIVTRILYGLTVRNPEPIGTGKGKLEFGASCDAVWRGTLTVVGLDGEEALVRYRQGSQLLAVENRPKRDVAEVSEVFCPSGTLFFIGRDAYLKRTVPARIGKVKDLLKWEKPRRVKIKRGRLTGAVTK